ncbi:hypothetical protein DSO57_1010685 [Entomophthora muscae]|uniref:Uncharacterized protein n=1 Tax=Entomophthora muscae TaxID=34485 RepID=A0ACC2SJ70_9FUNG|nr:hypothetical protein DSO57_1010685 [Entomophthora muscae]
MSSIETVPFSPPLPIGLLPTLSVGTLVVGFFFAAWFGVSGKSFVKESFLAICASVLLSFSVIFSCNAVGLFL